MDGILLVGEGDIAYNLINLKQLVFEVTEKCNLRCKYCGYADLYETHGKREDISLPLDYAISVIDYLLCIWNEFPVKGTHKVVHVSFYGGEPLLNIKLIKQIIDYLECLPQTGRIFKYGMTTNAMFLDRYMDYLVEKDFQLLISLDGDETGHSYRVDANGGNSFQRVLRNIKLLQHSYPQYFDDKVNFNSVLNDRNSTESIYNFIQNEFGKQPTIAEINPTGIQPHKRKAFDEIFRGLYADVEKSQNREDLEKRMFVSSPRTKLLIDYIYQSSGNVYKNYFQLCMGKNMNQKKMVSGTCSPFSKKMFITAKGKILSCERINHEFAFGKIVGKEVLMDFESIANQHNKYITKFINQCRTCASSGNCKLCVYQMDETLEAGGVCGYYTTKKKLEKIKTSIFEYLKEHPTIYQKILKEVTIRG